MKLIQTQFPLANINPGTSSKALLIFSIVLIAGTAISIYLIDKKNRENQTT